MTPTDQFKQFLEIANNSLTKQDFEAKFKMVLDMLKQMFERNHSEMMLLDSKYNEIVNGIKDDSMRGMDNAKKEMMDYCMSEMAKMTKDCDKMMAEMNVKVDAKMAEVHNGMDGKDGMNGKDGNIKDLSPEEIRNSLELLQGDERLTISAIKDLQEKLDELTNRAVGSRVGGGFSKIAMDSHLVDNETPAGTVNGVTVDFILASTPNPTSSLKVYVNGQRMQLTGDYTLSKNTITFLTAPPTNSIILVDYKT